MVKGTATLTESLALTASWLNISLDEPGQLGVTDAAFGNEFDVFIDWQATDRLFLSLAGAVLVPGEGAKQLAAAVLGSSSMVTFGEIPIKELRTGALTTLDLQNKCLGLLEALVLAGLPPVSHSLMQVCPTFVPRLALAVLLTACNVVVADQPIWKQDLRD